jgi:thermitase
MNTKLTAMLVAAACAAVAASAAADAAHASASFTRPTGVKQSSQRYAPGRMIVKLKPGLAPTARTSALRAHGARVQRRITQSALLVSVPDGKSVPDAVAAMNRDPRVEYAEPDWRGQDLAVPNDALFDLQWSLHNTGQVVNQVSGTAGADIHAPEAWDRTTGSPDVKVAVLDSGATFGHPDLAPNLWHNPGETGGGRESNGVDDDGDGFVDDSRGWDFVSGDNDPTDNQGHGTGTASVIAARGNNGIGMAGVAWQSTVIPVRVQDNNGLGWCSDWAAGIAYAAKVGARVVNMSVGTDEACKVVKDAIDAAPNVLFVISAGNDGLPAANYPCALPSPNILCVAATNSSDGLADFSNYNAQSVDLGAPGTKVVQAAPTWDQNGETFLDDGFETVVPGRWLTGGTPDTWDLTTANPRSGNWALTDSPGGNFANNTDNWVTLTQELDLRGKRNCFAGVWLYAQLNPFPSNWVGSNDRIEAETSLDGSHWGRPDVLSGQFRGYGFWQIDLSQLEGRDTAGRFRFRLLTDNVGAFDGVYLDDLEVKCFPPDANYTGGPNDFIYEDGTSFSAPLAAGAAALLLSLDPGLSAVDVKQKLMSSVDPIPALAGKTVSGGRLNVAKAVATIPVAPAGPPAVGRSASLADDLHALVKKLRIRALRRGVTVHAHAPGAGRLTLVVNSGRGIGLRTVAIGARSVKQAGAYSLKVKQTRAGRAVLRRARHLKVTVILSFSPRSGTGVAERTTLKLRR